MPMSEAALAGISANGHKWRYELSLSGLTTQIGDMDEATSEEDIRTCVTAIVERVRRFLKKPGIDPAMIYTIEIAVEGLEMADTDLEEARAAMGYLYDEFDFYRICVIR